jgi:hypothetical protein
MQKALLFTIAILCLITHGAFSQTLSFGYDADGNMSSRRVVVLKSADIAEVLERENLPEIVSAQVEEHTITIYPNPTKGRIVVKIHNLDYDRSNVVRLFNSQGQLIETLPISSSQTPLEISGSSGVYLLDIHLGSEVSRWKILKQ